MQDKNRHCSADWESERICISKINGQFRGVHVSILPFWHLQKVH